jgi:hypothetical protein
MHAPDMVFANHTAGESATGEEVRAHIASIFASLARPEVRDAAALRARGLVVQEWTATATHSNRCGAATSRRRRRQDDLLGRDRLDPFEDGLIKRKDVYSDSVSILRQVGLLD